MTRKFRFQLGFFIIILACVIGFYQFQLSKYKGIEMVWTYQVKNKKDNVITKGTELNESMFEQVLKDKHSLPSDYIKTPQEISGKVALENLYPFDTLTNTKVVDKKKWDKDEDKYVCLVSSDNFGGADIRPTDKVNIYIFDALTQQYIKEAENIEVLKIRDKDFIEYTEIKDKKFIPYSIYFKNTDANFKKLIDKASNPQAKIRVSINGNRPNTERSQTISENTGIINPK